MRHGGSADLTHKLVTGGGSDRKRFYAPLMTADIDRFDATRREWIAAHRSWLTIQDRRQQRLDQMIRRRQREVTGAVPDPHDDVVLPPIWLRIAKSPAAQVEWITVNIIAALVPPGWLLGWIVHRIITRIVPGTLRGYPIPALLAASAVLGVLTVASYDPADTTSSILLSAWIPLQLAAVPAVAGIYGVLDGWLAVRGSTSWWPLTPTHHRLSSGDAEEILGSYDLTGPGIVDARPLIEEGERRP